MSKDSIRCDSCGKFIAYKELDEGGGASTVFVPDTEVTEEEFKAKCKKCTKKSGKVESYQYATPPMFTNYIH